MKRLITLLMLFAAGVTDIFAAGGVPDTDGSAKPKDRPKIALVLAGGGAKGAAHIGVLKVLEEAGVPIDMIVGTSIGGLVGGMYAMGYSADQLDSIISRCDWKYLLSDNTARRDESFSGKAIDSKFLIKIPFYSLHKKPADTTAVELDNSALSYLPGGLISGQNVLNFLNGLSVGYQGDMDFSHLPIPFACVATDLETGLPVVLDRGHVPMAMRATMAIPGVFAPVEIDGKVLVDGGVVNNFPVDVARRMGADIIIGVDLHKGLAASYNLKSISQVLNQLMGIMGLESYRENIKDVDIYIKPDLGPYGTYSFNDEAMQALIKSGYAAGMEKYAELKELGDRFNSFRAGSRRKPVRKATEVVNETFCFDTIRINGVKHSDGEWLKRLANLRENVPVTGNDINKAVSLLVGTRTFSSVKYTVKQVEDGEQLVFDLVRGPANILAFSGRFDSEEAAAILVHLGVHEYDLFGSKLGITGRLSYNPYGQLDYSFTPKKFPRVNVSYRVGKTDINIYKSTKDESYLSFLYHKVKLNLSNIYLRNFNIEAGVKFENIDYDDFYNGMVPDKYQKYTAKDRSYLSYYVKLLMDNRDDSFYPTRGMTLDAQAAFYHTDFHSDFSGFGAFRLMLSGAIDVSRRFTVLPSFYGRVLAGDCNNVPHRNYVGGSMPGRYMDHQLPFIGINHAVVVYNSALIGRVDLRERIGKKHYVTAMFNYMRTGHAFGDLFTDLGENMWGCGLQYSYHTPVGPLSLDVHWSDYNHRVGAYLNFGYYF